MSELLELFEQVLDQELIQVILSNTRDAAQGEKLKVRPVLIKGKLCFQETLYRDKKVFHTNYQKEQMARRLEACLDRDGVFRQAQITCESMDAVVLVSRKGAVSVKRKNKVPGKNMPQQAVGDQQMRRGQQEAGDQQMRRGQQAVGGQQAARTGRDEALQRLSHDRVKQYILPEGQPVDFLVDLGVQSSDGRITRARYDKFRQINRYLEFIEDILDKLPTDRCIRIIDFGCGKSYLTFAMYYYLRRLQGRDIQVTGLDLKEDVIRHCEELARKLHYDGLNFCQGDISSYEGAGQVDMVVSLHACDKATDYALEKAVKWGASVIMAVPCCQHELNGQIRCDMLRPVLKYGVIRERMAALITDALRADLLEQNGYDTQILEFIDMEHTPKNLMIRAVKASGMRPGQTAASVEKVMEFLHVNPVLKELL